MGEDCCSQGCTGTCANGASIDTIANGFAQYGSFQQTGALSEDDLKAELSAGRPVARITTGHIDVVTGCAPDGKYTVVDSEYADPFTAPYSDLMQSPYNPAAKWVASFKMSAAQTIV